MATPGKVERWKERKRETEGQIDIEGVGKRGDVADNYSTLACLLALWGCL